MVNVRTGSWPGDQQDGRATGHVVRWWDAITDLNQQLPDHPAADDYLQAQLVAFYTARDAVYIADSIRTGRVVPTPEYDGPLPRGFRYGLHRP